jgi:biotin transport system substrate-specific component
VTRANSPSSTLVDLVWPGSGSLAPARAIVLAVLGVALLTASAKLKVPFYPVPMTMQTFVVLVLGAAYGWRLGSATLLAYLAAGALGWPVFADTPAKGIGLAYMMGPTGGYLVGFAVAAALAGVFAARGWDRNAGWLFAAMLFGHAVIFICGVAWLAQHIGLSRAWTFGVAPFYWATLLKSALAVAVLRGAWRFAGRG